MGTTLTGTTPQDTYDSLIKVTDNGPLSGTAKYLSDGLGNDSALALSTTAVGINYTLPARAFHVVSNFPQIRISDVAAPTTNFWEIQSTFANTNQDFFISNQGGTALAINASRNVGIGTSAPLERLVVSGGCLQVTGALSSLDRASSSVVDFFNGSSRIFSIGANASTHGNISFNTATTAGTLERAIITSDGYLRLTVNSGGIQFNDDTAAANALDDYEEGTWTMGVSFGGGTTGITYGSNTGRYTKVGRIVTVSGYLSLSSKGSSTGTASLTGLPFSGGAGGVASCFLNLVTYTGTPQFVGLGSESTVRIYQLTEAGAITQLTDTNFSNTSEIYITYTFTV